MPVRQIIPTIILALTASALSAAETEDLSADPPVEEAPASLTPEEVRSAIIIESVSIPTPGEFFAAINKIDRPNWTQFDHPEPLAPTTSRAKLSLNVGTRVADGFIAVEAQDGQQVKNTGRDIIDLAKALGVSESIIARGRSIGDFAENNEWSALKEELEATENDVKLQMMEQRDEALITLVTLGAWIRGTQAASRVISENYSPQSAELLRQPAIIDYLLSRLNELPSRLREDPLINKVRSGVEQLQSLSKGSGPLPMDDVTIFFKTTSDLVNGINGVEETTES